MKFTVKERMYTGDQIYINENLNPAMKQLFYQANKKRRKLDWKYIWTKNGTIYAKKMRGVDW